MNTLKKQIEHPFSTNFNTLLQYDYSKCSSNETLFFEWLCIKRQNFGSNTFYHKNEIVYTEIGIKRKRLETIKTRFKNYGLIIVNEQQTNITNYTVNDEFIEMFIDKHVKLERQEILKKQILNYSFKKNHSLTTSEIKKVKQLIILLTNIYNDRRKFLTNEKPFYYSETELAVNNKTNWQLNQLLKNYTKETIILSFIAFSDAIINKDFETKNELNSFSSYNKTENKFPIFEMHLNIYNTSYKTAR